MVEVTIQFRKLTFCLVGNRPRPDCTCSLVVSGGTGVGTMAPREFVKFAATFAASAPFCRFCGEGVALGLGAETPEKWVIAFCRVVMGLLLGLLVLLCQILYNLLLHEFPQLVVGLFHIV